MNFVRSRFRVFVIKVLFFIDCKDITIKQLISIIGFGMPGKKKMQAAQEAIIDDLLDELKPLRFESPVSHVYNPLACARLHMPNIYSSMPSHPRNLS